ncbi:protein CURVATURE THYLAKOID 1D, chloroplastic-like isoform X2 [Carex rostrata]
MALAFAILSPPLTSFGTRQLASRVAPKLLFCQVSGEKRNNLVVAKAVADSSESSSGSIVKSVQTAAVDKLPLLPGFFEYIGILYSSWFVYRYLLFKPDREELGTIIKSSISRITGQ